MLRTRRIASIGAASACVLAGGAIGISQSAAAGGSAHTAKTSGSHALPRGAGGGGFGGGFGGPGGGAVHSVSEVLDKAGTAYISQTTDSGTITAVDASADTITVKEGNSKVTYATPTVTIASDASVVLDGAKSSLSDLAAGERVTITTSSDGTSVFATKSSYHQGPGGGGAGGGWGGPGGTPPTSPSAG